MQATENTFPAPDGPRPATFTLTDSAASRINYLKSKNSSPSLRMRIAVKGGGCSGFQYEFGLDSAEPAADDKVFSHNGADVVMDELSLSIIGGSTLDFVEDLSSAGFEIKNPNATARCGCGNSFSVSL